MSEKAAQRKRYTNQLVRVIADYLLQQDEISAQQLYGLCRLTWITSGIEQDNAPYIRSTKLPALQDIFGGRIRIDGIEDAGRDVASVLGQPKVYLWVQRETGFTQFYAAYRNSALPWLRSNRKAVASMIREACNLKTDHQAEKLALAIDKLPSIPKANNPEHLMRAHNLLMPLMFSLDPRLRFPIINGRKAVQQLLSKKGVRNASLDAQVRAMVGLIGKGGIEDAASLDSVGQGNLLLEIDVPAGKESRVSLLTTKPTEGKDLPLKDEEDYESIQKGTTQYRRRLHNRMTNRLKEILSDYNLLEGQGRYEKYDVLVKEYSREIDLLIEVKSSEEEPHVRMAIGQLFAYAYHLQSKPTPHLAILLPVEPTEEVKGLLKSLGIGCLWFIGDDLDQLATCTSRLNTLVA